MFLAVVSNVKKLFLSLILLFAADLAAQTGTTVTGTVKTQGQQTPTQAGLEQTDTIATQVVFGTVDFQAVDTRGNIPREVTCGGNTYVPSRRRAWIRGDGQWIDDTGALGVRLVPNAGCTPSGLGTRAIFNLAGTASGSIAPLQNFVQVKVVPDQASVDWASLSVAVAQTAAVLVQLQNAATILDFEDFTGTAAPANPAAGKARFYFDSSTARMACRTSTGADCNPAGAGGTITVREVDTVPTVASVSTIEFDQADGFVVSTPGAGIARLDLSAIPDAALAANYSGVGTCGANLVVTAAVDNAAPTCTALTDAYVPDTLTASNYLLLTGGTLTGTLTVRAGAAGAGTAPVKFQAGSLTTTAEAHAFEWDGANLFITQSAGPTRQQLLYTTGNAATATALAADPTDCPANQYANAIAASGNLACSAVNFSQLAGSLALAQTPLTTLGDVLYVNATPALARLAGNTTTTRQFLSQTGTGTVSAAPAWTALADGDIPATLARDAEINVQGTTDEITVTGSPGVAPTVALAATLNLTAKVLSGGTPLVFEGATANLFETSFSFTDPTADQTVTFPDATGEVSLLGQSIADAELVSNYSGVGGCTNQFPRTLNDNGAPTCADVAGLDFATQSANLVLAGPSSGAAADPTFRALVDDDVPNTITASNYLLLTGGVLTGVLEIDNQLELRLRELGANGVNYIGFRSIAARAANLTLDWAVTGNCTGNVNAGALTINASNEIVCSDDDGGAGGSGDAIEIEQGDNTGVFDPIDTTARFDDSGDINFVFTDGAVGGPDTVTATVRPDSVALTTDTTGNYVASVATSTGLTGGAAGSEGAALTLSFDFSDAGSDPTLAAGECRFSNEGVNPAGWVCEGETANTFEVRFQVTDPTAERTVTWPDASGEVSLLGQTIGDAELVSNYSGVGSCTNQFVRAVNDNAAPTCADVALTTDTTGNYIASLSSGTGLTSFPAAAEGATGTPALNYADTLAGNPAFNLGEAVFSNDCTGGGFLSEGTTANINEMLYCFPALDEADTTHTLVTETATQTLTNKTLTAANNAIEADDLICTDCIGTTEIADVYLLNTGDTLTTADLIVEAVQVDFEGGASEGFPRLAQSVTPPTTACDAAAEAGRLYFDTDADTDGSVFVCRGTAGWKDIDDDGAAGFSSFTVSGDGGVDQTITDANILEIAGTTGIITAGAATDILNVSLEYADTLVGNPAFNLGEAVFSDDCTGGGFLSEGTVANTNEMLFCFPALDEADTTHTLVSTTATQMLTGKTYDVEGTGNVFTDVLRWEFHAAICSGGVANRVWDDSPLSVEGTAACIAGTNRTRGVVDLDAATDENLGQIEFQLPSGWTGNIDVDIYWLAAAVTGNVDFNIQTGCTATGETMDAALNAAQSVVDATQGTANQYNIATQAAVTTTGCAAGERFTLYIFRDADDATNDTMAGDARVVTVVVTLRVQK
jgi:hypothetical protein